MLAGLSKAISLYLAPLLALAAVFLSLFAYLAPAGLLHTTALLNVRSTPGGQNASSSTAMFVYLGTLGSCVKPDQESPIQCTKLSSTPNYDLRLLPASSPKLILSAPTRGTPETLAIGISFSILFFISFTLISFRHKLPAGGRLGEILDKPVFQRISAWLGIAGFLLGIASSLVLRLWFGKSASDFNQTVALQAVDFQPLLVASLGNVFTLMYVGYAFYAVPVVISLSKMNLPTKPQVQVALPEPQAVPAQDEP
ncbi:hypothetical protein MKEN_00530000 [Mycena kentingensis (nom. inval.)]|nr:hypothetical protein MKEN_00530000 [Mycena kentingensis (nom. inval.)]